MWQMEDNNKKEQQRCLQFYYAISSSLLSSSFFPFFLILFEHFPASAHSFPIFEHKLNFKAKTENLI